MKLIDVNILLYAIDETSFHHEQVIEHWQLLLNGDESVGIPWIVLTGFLRLSTSARIFENALDPMDAFDLVDEWIGRSNVFIPMEKPEHSAVLRDLVASSGTAGNLVTDAHIAAFGITYDATVFSCDRDFKRFNGLRSENPLDRKSG